MDFTKDELAYIVDTAIDLKGKLRKGETHEMLKGKTAMMIFEKLSTRTRISFQASCAHLGMQSFFAMPQQHKGRIEGLKLAYAGDVWNVCQTLMIAGSLFGMDVYVARPVGYEPVEKIMNFVEEQAPKSGAAIKITDSLEEAMKDADIVYANTWHSMGGPEKTKEQRIEDFTPYQINVEAMLWAKKDAIFMHCLPGYRGEEMTDEVIEGPQSVVFDQAENRMHTEKAVLTLVVK
jgi:ornithine carbamoyltransferase